MTASDICKKPAITADPNETVVAAAQRMRQEHVGDVVVTDEGNHPIGMLTDRDIVVSAVAQSADRLMTLRVGDVMTLDPVTAAWDEPVEVALTRMTRHGVRRLPVMGPDGAITGILTLDDIVRALSFELSGLIGAVARERDHERLVRA
jgi:CBS domain-containing protein